jgi:hypothetical protein
MARTCLGKENCPVRLLGLRVSSGDECLVMPLEVVELVVSTLSLVKVELGLLGW